MRGRLSSLTSCAGAMLALWFCCPSQISAQLVTRTITLTWDASPSQNVAGYRLYYGQEKGVYPRVIDVGNQTIADVPNLIEGITYYFGVSAYDTDGTESSVSPEFRYTPNPSLFLNISTRAKVGTDDGVMIAGFIIGGSGEKKTVIRALGPSLTDAGVSGALEDPFLELYGPTGSLLLTNDNWQEGNADELTALNLRPAYGVEAAMVVRLRPGNYSVAVRGKNAGTGTALLEVYDGGN